MEASRALPQLEQTKIEVTMADGKRRWAMAWTDYDCPGLAVAKIDGAYVVVHVPTGHNVLPREFKRRTQAVAALRWLNDEAKAKGFSWNAGVEELRQGAAVGVWVEARKKFR